MFGYFTEHPYTACERCGMSLSPADRTTHVCNAESRARFESFQVQHELARFDRQFADFLRSPTGRFAVYCAERDRRYEAL